MKENKKNKLFIVVSEDWSFWSHRISLALSAIENGFDVTVLTNLNKHEDKIKEKNIKVININFVRSSKSPLNDLLNLIKLNSVYRKEKPDIIHNVGLKIIVVSTLAAISLKNVSIANAFTGLGYVFSSNELQVKFIRLFVKPFLWLIAKSKKVWTIFQNPDDMSLFKKYGLISQDRNILIRGSGVETNEFVQTDDTNKVPVVMLASRMLWDKGVGEFVEAVKLIVKEKKIKAKFILVGDVDEANPMSIPVSTLNQWVNEGHILWNGHSDNMPETLRTASIVCLPSYREGLPKVLLEAAAIGRALIATDVPGCREIVKNRKNGILVKLKDVNSLYSAIKELILNGEMRRTMGQNSRDIVESEFSAEIINAQTNLFYKKILNISF